MDAERRFGGLDRLYGAGARERLAAAHVMVAGIGGVGTWAVEALARSAVGRITLIDLDNIAESNINRQLPALDSTLGMAKIEAMAQRIAQINPHCQLQLIEDFVTEDNAASLMEQRPDVFLDCTDQASAKIALILQAKRCKKQLRFTGQTAIQKRLSLHARQEPALCGWRPPMTLLILDIDIAAAAFANPAVRIQKNHIKELGMLFQQGSGVLIPGAMRGLPGLGVPVVAQFRATARHAFQVQFQQGDLAVRVYPQGFYQFRGLQDTCFPQALQPFLVRVRVQHNATAHAKPSLAVIVQFQTADADIQGQIALGAEITHRAAVNTAPLRLQLVYALHGSQLGGAGNRTTGEQGAQQGLQAAIRLYVGLNAGSHGPDRGILLYIEQAGETVQAKATGYDDHPNPDTQRRLPGDGWPVRYRDHAVPCRLTFNSGFA
uniref:ThiF domain-containing protein n=1 Tax=Steinernema glaseri TaxID=37863 RepID=A0A1I8ANY8_9BILA